jgi:hypothetical protein
MYNSCSDQQCCRVEKMDIGLLQLKEKRELVERVANSQTFQRSPRLREFLLYVADCTLNDRLDDVREQQIAQNVFHRKPDYNPGMDNIVRVEARMLRKRLESYFSDEGRDARLLITMPKGSYSISFEPREQVATEDPAQTNLPAVGDLSQGSHATAAATGEGVPQPALAEGQVPPPHLSVAFQRIAWMIAGVLVFLAAGAAILDYSVRKTDRIEARAARFFPLSALFDDKRETYIVTSDTSLVMIQQLTGQRVSLNDYINHQYPGDPAAPKSSNQALFRLLQYRNYTDGDEITAAGKMLVQNSRYSQRIFVHSAREVQLPELKERNVVLLGSPESNPWGNLYYENLPFQFDDAKLGAIRNLAARSGESKQYFTPTRSGQIGDVFAIVAFLPNIGGTGYALLTAGTTAEGTVAAEEFVLDQAHLSTALRTMGIDAAGPPHYFEILLKVKTFPGSATQASVEAWRLLPAADIKRPNSPSY